MPRMPRLPRMPRMPCGSVIKNKQDNPSMRTHFDKVEKFPVLVGETLTQKNLMKTVSWQLLATWINICSCYHLSSSSSSFSSSSSAFGGDKVCRNVSPLAPPAGNQAQTWTTTTMRKQKASDRRTRRAQKGEDSSRSNGRGRLGSRRRLDPAGEAGSSDSFVAGKGRGGGGRHGLAGGRG